MLYAYCAERGIPHRRCGKLIVATSNDQRLSLEAIQAQAQANGVDDLQWLGRDEARALEPALECVAALLSPSTGIVDSHALMLALQGDLEHAGGMVALNSPVAKAECGPDAIEIEAADGTQLCARTVVNAAGLYADDVSAMLGGERFTIYPCRGEYAELVPAKRSLVNSPVYPLPHASGHSLGVHLTKTIHGNVTLGPTVCFQARKDDYELDRLPVEDRSTWH